MNDVENSFANLSASNVEIPNDSQNEPSIKVDALHSIVGNNPLSESTFTKNKKSGIAILART
jgi:hypothetical protein